MSYFDQTGPEKIREEIVVAVDAPNATQFQLDMKALLFQIRFFCFITTFFAALR